MKAAKSSVLMRLRCLCVLLLMLSVCSVGRCGPDSGAGGADADGKSLADFAAALKASDDTKAALTGDTIFGGLAEKYGSDADFRALKSKLAAAEFLAAEMMAQLRKAKDSRMLLLAGDLFDEKKSGKKRALSIAPAKSFYETSVKLFSNPVRMGHLTEEERVFLVGYYDLKLRGLTGQIAKAGQALVVAEPEFKSTHDYVLVLPLLHASEKEGVNIDVLPRWMREPEQLGIFSDSCLLHFGFSFQAMTVARECSGVRNEAFSELDFYKSAAKKCGRSRAHVAVDSLVKAMGCVGKEDVNATIGLHFEIVQVWLDSGNYALAAGRAREIFETYPERADSGKAIWLYYYALSRVNNTDEILAHIDEALEDSRCRTYRGKLMYIKWWALRSERDETGRVAAIEHELLEQYGDDPMVAPILLSRAVDLLARQDYSGAYAILTRLVDKFPLTKAAEQARRMVDKLKDISGL